MGLIAWCLYHRYEYVTAEQLAADGKQYDLVVASEVIEHVRRPADFMSTLTQLTAPGGQVVITTLNRTPRSFLLAIAGAEYVLSLVPRGERVEGGNSSIFPG